jgi:hypothetical protein
MNIPETNTTSQSVSNPVKIPVTLTSNANDDVVATAVTYFCMTPSQTGEDWTTVLVPTGVTSSQEAHAEIELDSLEYEFQSIEGEDEKQKALEPYQKALLIIDLNPNSGDWLFCDGGIEYCSKPSEEDCRVKTKITNEGKRLVMSLDRISSLGELTVAFKYIASFTESCGSKTTHYSQDPKVSVRRVRR